MNTSVGGEKCLSVVMMTITLVPFFATALVVFLLPNLSVPLESLVGTRVLVACC